ncbi:MAG TPA: Crp/Fnr family transcriptional regulator [Caulobacter sp.]|nr:Crp/Fnr family transcriptional regulator [Caulobacter sp.]
MSDAFPSHRELDKLVRKLAGLAALNDEDEREIRALPLTIRLVGPNQEIAAEGDEPTECALVLDGLLCRHKVLSNGGRQILSFHMPGDIVDLQTLHLRPLDHGLSSISASRIGCIPHAALHALVRKQPAVAAALWQDTLLDAAVLREWLTAIGRRSAYQRIAHLLCELYVRLRAVDLTEQDGFDLPLTQTEIGDVLGLTAVHVNRVLQELRKHAIIASRGRFLRILDWRALQRAGDFDPAYLYTDQTVTTSVD